MKPCYVIVTILVVLCTGVPAQPSGPTTCPGDNMQFYGCGWCKTTCDKPLVACNLMCRIDGECGCKPGYVLDKEGGKCILQKECPPKQCPAEDNMQFYVCGWCQATCENPVPACSFVCRLPGNCGCKPGYVLDKVGGKCISQSQCPSTQP